MLTVRGMLLPSPSLYTLPGCLDSLVYYKRLLVGLLEPEGEATRGEREALNLEALGMLRKLEQVDPMRGNRYRDLGKSYCLSPSARDEHRLTPLASQRFTSCRTRGKSDDNVN